MSRNDITGDNLTSKATSDAYRDGWDRIFGKGNEMATCVEIEKNEDGSFTVTDCSNEEGLEGKGMHRMPDGQMMRDDMMQGGQGGMGGMQGEMEAEGQQVPSLKDALMAAADILTSGGSTDMAAKQAAFSSADERLTR